MTDIQILYTGPIVNRADAKAAGLKSYFDGGVCSSGHVDQRRTSNGTCIKCSLLASRKWRKYNKARMSKYNKEWRGDNAESYRLYNKEWQKNNPDKKRKHNSDRRALVTGAEGRFSDVNISEIMAKQSNKCAEPTCRTDLTDGYHVDHIMPLSKGGSNWPSNLQCLCVSCNLRKHAKHPIDWARENGRLL